MKIVAAAAALALGLSSTAQAEGKIRIAEQFGIVDLLLNVAQDQKLIEKHGKKQGIDIDVDFVKLSRGSAANDALLSGSIDVAGAGLGPLFTIRDRTAGRQTVPHPDAAAALIAGKTELNAHFGNPPFQDQELAGNPAAHGVLNSYDVLDGPSSATVLYATEKYVKENPKT